MDNNGSYHIGKYAGLKDFIHNFGFSLGLIILMGLPAYSIELNALPVGISVQSGNVYTNQSNNSLSINSNSNKAIVNYQSFNVGSNASVNFNLPSSSSAILNRVTGSTGSEIYGSINSNGHVFLINPNGILFGSNSQINVGGLTASTLYLSNDDFLLSNYKFIQGNTPSSVINLGNIVAENSINLLGSAVHNHGSLTAQNINLAVGEQITLDLKDGLYASATIDQALKNKVEGINEGILNTGFIQANNVKLHSELETAFYESLVNNEGLIKAVSLGEKNGSVELLGYSKDQDGIVSNSGTIEGDKVAVVGDHTRLEDSSLINGQEVLVGGDFQGSNPEIKNAQTTFVAENSTINTLKEDGKVIFWADKATEFLGQINAPAGFVEVSGKDLVFDGLVSTKTIDGRFGTLLLDPEDITIASTDPFDGTTFFRCFYTSN